MKFEKTLSKELILDTFNTSRNQQVDEWVGSWMVNEFIIYVHSVPMCSNIEHIKDATKVMVRICDLNDKPIPVNRDQRFRQFSWAKKMVILGWGTLTIDELVDCVNYCIRWSNLKAFL